jgi:hypothetical protein
VIRDLDKQLGFGRADTDINGSGLLGLGVFNDIVQRLGQHDFCG